MFCDSPSPSDGWVPWLLLILLSGSTGRSLASVGSRSSRASLAGAGCTRPLGSIIRTSKNHLTKNPLLAPDTQGDPAELLSTLPMIRDRSCNEIPKLRRVIKLPQVAELVGDHIVGEMKRKTRDTIVEVEVPSLGATPPARSLIAYRDPVVHKPIQLVENYQPMMHKSACSHPKRRVDVLCVKLNGFFHNLEDLIVPKIPREGDVRLLI